MTQWTTINKKSQAFRPGLFNFQKTNLTYICFNISSSKLHFHRWADMNWRQVNLTSSIFWDPRHGLHHQGSIWIVLPFTFPFTIRWTVFQSSFWSWNPIVSSVPQFLFQIQTFQGNYGSTKSRRLALSSGWEVIRVWLTSIRQRGSLFAPRSSAGIGCYFTIDICLVTPKAKVTSADTIASRNLFPELPILEFEILPSVQILLLPHRSRSGKGIGF